MEAFGVHYGATNENPPLLVIPELRLGGQSFPWKKISETPILPILLQFSVETTARPDVSVESSSVLIHKRHSRFPNDDLLIPR